MRVDGHISLYETLYIDYDQYGATLQLDGSRTTLDLPVEIEHLESLFRFVYDMNRGKVCKSGSRGGFLRQYRTRT